MSGLEPGTLALAEPARYRRRQIVRSSKLARLEIAGAGTIDLPPFSDDLSRRGAIAADIVSEAVSAMGRWTFWLITPVHYAAPMAEWDDVINLNLWSQAFFYRRRSRAVYSPRAAAEGSLTSRPCSRSPGGFASLVLPQKRRARFNPPDGQQNGPDRISATSMPSPQVRQCTDNASSYAVISEIRGIIDHVQPGAGASRMIYRRARSCSASPGSELHQWIYLCEVDGGWLAR